MTPRADAPTTARTPSLDPPRRAPRHSAALPLRALPVLVLLASGCTKKPAGTANDQTSATTSGATGATGAAGATGSGAVPSATPAVHTAEGEAVGALPVVDDCPRSLGGAEAVARTIKKACGPILVTREYDINGSLTLEAGSILRFQDGAELDVGYNGPAKLIIRGTESDPVVLTSAGDPAPGAWAGVRLYAGAARSQLSHVVIENAGNDRGALYIDASSVVLKGATIRSAKDIGLRVDHHGDFTEMSGNTFDRAGKIAVTAFPRAIGALGSNKFDDGAFVQIERGAVEDSARWQNPGAPYVVVGEVDVDGKNGRATLELQAGTELRCKDAEIDVGYNSNATLVVSGTPDRPVVFTTAEDRTPGAWHGVQVYGHGEARIAGAVFSYGGGAADRGAVFLDHGTASITGTTFQGNLRAVNVGTGSTLKTFDHNTVSAGSGAALTIAADQVGALGAGNTFDKEARIEVLGGEIQSSVTWTPQTVPYEITGEISVNQRATLTLAPGIDLAFAAEQQLSIGYSSDATLKAIGTADRPIKLHAMRDDASWKGVYLYEHAFGNELAQVQLTGASGDAGIVVHRGATGKITDVACARCAAATLTSQCGARLTTAGIKAEAGTPRAEIKPDCPN